MGGNRTGGFRGLSSVVERLVRTSGAGQETGPGVRVDVGQGGRGAGGCPPWRAGPPLV